jgi:predicted DNA-binding transcriptional regulator AlpA
MDLNSLIRSDNAANIQLVVNAKDLRDLLDSAMAFAKKEIKERDEPDYYTRDELAAKLHVSLVTLNRWRNDGRIPEPVTIDGRVLYDKAEVRDMINGNRKLTHKLNQKGITL